ncbi:MAG TPA: hydroxymethylpyrimidine/phosphomethylpyrimidine kinase [Steroidobacteraceae bacterium]
MQPKESRPSVLVIAATDSSGGAGLSRDVRVLSDFAVDALCVATAVTAQSDKRVLAIHYVPPEIIRTQLMAAFETRRVGAVKVGMLGNRATVEAVAATLAATVAAMVAEAGLPGAPAVAAPGGDTPGETDRVSGTEGRPGRLSRLLSHGLASHATVPIVVDPVLVSSSGRVLLDSRGRAALLEKLLPLATLVTPNVPEIAALLGEPIAADEVERVNQACRLLEFGCQAILLKGGHATGEEAVDLLVTHGNNISSERRQPDGRPSEPGRVANTVGNLIIERIASKRVPATSRGTGCALASGIAATLASGHSLVEACRRAKRYVLETMLTPPGM